MYDENRANSTKWLEPPQEELGLKRYVETIRERLWFVVWPSLSARAWRLQMS